MLEVLPRTEGREGWPWDQETPLDIYDKKVKWPKITIVTPSYNHGEFIEETIRSVLLQNYPNLEYIVIDGGSKDDTKSILNKYSPWLFYWVSEKDNGQADAINKGFQKATGDILAYLNSDDLYLPGTLHTVAEYFIKAGNTRLLLSGKLKVFPGNKIMWGNPAFSVKDWIKKIDYTLPQPSSFWSNHTGFARMDEKLHFVFDRLFFIHLRQNGYFLQIIPEELAAFRLHEASKTSSLSNSFYKENKKVNFELAKQYGNLFYFSIKRKHLFLENRERFLKTRKINPHSIYFLVNFFLNFPGIIVQRWYWAWLKYIVNNTFWPKPLQHEKVKAD